MRDSRGRFAKGGDLSIPLPCLVGIYKILIILILIFPWYVIISNRNFSGAIFGYLLGNKSDFCPKCECEECIFELPKVPPEKCPPRQECIIPSDFTCTLPPDFKCPECVCQCKGSVG